MFMNHKVDEIRAKHPVGTPVELVCMNDIHAPAPGTRGIVTHVDDIGQIHVAWENGLALALVPGADKWNIVNEKKGDVVHD